MSASPRVVAAVLAVLFLASIAASAVVTPMQRGRVAVDIETFGASREEAVASARRAAVDSTVARILADGRLLLAEDLLERYLDNYASNFVQSVEVLSDTPLRGGSLVRSRVFVDTPRLVADLEEKRFLFQPAVRPRFLVFLAETVDGSASPRASARQALSSAIDEVGLTPADAEVMTPPRDSNPLLDAESFSASRVAAERSGAEIVFAGEARSRFIERRQLYLDEFVFVETTLEARMIRVDTGEEIARVRTVGSASDPDADTALARSARLAAEEAAESFMRAYDAYWPFVVQGEADFTLLVTGADEGNLALIASRITGLGDGARVVVRRKLGSTAVLSVMHNGDRAGLLAAVGQMGFPRVNILNPGAEDLFELQVVAD